MVHTNYCFFQTIRAAIRNIFSSSIKACDRNEKTGTSRGTLFSGIKTIFLVVASLFSSIHGFTPHEPQDDYASIQVEHFFIHTSDSSRFAGKERFQNIWAYIGLPGFRILDKNVFTALEYDAINRDVYLDGIPANAAMMQRFGIFAGITLINKGNQTGSFMFGTGAATDFDLPGRDALYFHGIYDHRITISDKLTIGLGILFSYDCGAPKDPPVNLLPTLRWQAGPRTFLKIAWDNFEFRHFITERIAGVAEIRYDLSFFQLKNHTTYTFETVGAGAGLDIWLVKNWYLRIRYKELLVKNEALTRNAIAYKAPSFQIGDGRSIRILAVYGK